MSDRDYKNAGRPGRGRRRSRSPLWIWVAGGLAIGIAIGFAPAVFRTLGDTASTLGQALEPPEKKPPPRPPASALEPPDEDQPHFEFYTLLPEMEVVIPPEELQAPQNGGTRYLYRLQVGSFIAPADADALKARCTLLGFEPEIVAARLDEGVRYRVRIGPFERARDADTARRRLFEHDIDSIVLRETLPPEG